MDYIVSINILNYNTYEKSCVCIDSCLRQQNIGFQVLLIDNASTDDSFNQLKQKYGNKLSYLQTGKNLGFAGGNNFGVMHCLKNGIKYAFLLNSDTELIGNDCLANLINVIMKFDRCAIVSPTIFDVTKKGLLKHSNDYNYNKLLRCINILPRIERLSGNIEKVSEAHGSALLVDCQRFIDVGGFPEHYFMYCEESTFAKKTLWAGFDILWYQSNSNYILHHHDKTGNVDSWREILMGRNRSLEYHENCRGKTHLWSFIYYLFELKMYVLGIRTKNMSYYKGMKLGDKLYKQNYSEENCFLNGLEIKNTF